MVPVKATTEQQENYERAIVQKHMKQEMESNQYMFEMQLDSASNYMQTKISNFEGELAQSRQQIADLKSKKTALEKKLANEKKKVDKLIAQLQQKKRLNEPAALITCVSEEEEVDPDNQAQELPDTYSSFIPTSSLGRTSWTVCI